MALKLITGPAAEPISLDEAKLHLRAENGDEEEALISALITAAREAAEHQTGRALLEQTWELALDAFPCEICLPHPPLIEIVSVTYIDQAGEGQTLEPSAYVLDAHSEPARLIPAYGTCWPATRCQPGAVVVQFKAGYPDADAVPAGIKQWMLLQIGAMYENREAEAMSSFGAVTLGFADRLLDRYKVY